MNALATVEMAPARVERDETCPSCCSPSTPITAEMKPCARCRAREAAGKALAAQAKADERHAADEEHARLMEADREGCETLRELKKESEFHGKSWRR